MTLNNKNAVIYGVSDSLGLLATGIGELRVAGWEEGDPTPGALLADYTRKAMQCNIDGMNSIMRARTPQDLIAAQSELLNAEIEKRNERCHREALR